MSLRWVVVGGGIVGLAVAHRITREHPGAQVTVIEKESSWGAHQSGHNSGVIHSGLFYPPGSLKARLCRAGASSLVDFCRQYGIPVEVCGKLVVATEPSELPRLRALYERGLAGGLPVRLISAEQSRDYEPHLSCLAAIQVASAGIVDFGAVCRRLAGLLEGAGAELRRDEQVVALRPNGSGVVVGTNRGEVRADVLVNCAGLHADRVARMAGIDPPARIVPFRGEYYQLRDDRRDLVRGLIYPVGDPRFPFLGVHLTAMIDGSVHAGPNAVLALSREGYRWGQVSPRDVLEMLGYQGLWRLGGRHLGYGLTEVRRSLSRRRFAASVARMVPEITAADLVPAGAGVRAQAVLRSGELVDDFLIVVRDRQVHVLNAPSPAATSSLRIAAHIVSQLRGTGIRPAS
jgi:L-2-hydroxyglutarate oxidase